jgi:hypothetical protein
MQDLNDFMREFLDYYFTQVHTSLPGAIVDYDAATRRATVQPSLKRRTGNKEYINFPLLIDVPVLFSGTKRWTIHFPLEENDEVAIFFSERALEAWKDVGQDGIEDSDPRRYDLSDAYCIPGLQPQEFIAATEPGLQIIHKEKFDGDFISHVLMTDDKVEVKYKKKATVLIDDNHINAETGNGKVDLNDGAYLQQVMDSDIKSTAPVGINDGLYKTGLSPYLTAETAAAAALNAAATSANPQLAILDALSGGTGFITALGTAIIAFCAAVDAMDSAAHTAIAKAVK